MKLVTQDYGCGTSSSILDYGISDVVIVSENDYEHVFDVEDNLLFIGHDFLFFLWDNEEKLKRWHSRKGKWEHWVWCFERIDAIVPVWQQKSHISLGIAKTFCSRILACDEDDCDKYGFDWLPQWASCRFHSERNFIEPNERILFSGQAGKPEYEIRNKLLSSIQADHEISDKFVITNISRDLHWNSYITNLLSYQTILNPLGILRGLNTRAYEALYSGRILLQQTAGVYSRHESMLRDNPGVIFFRDYDDMKKNLVNISSIKTNSDMSFTQNSLFHRMNSIGLEIK